MPIQTSLHLNHRSLFSVVHTIVLPVLKTTTQAAESWLETHLASLSPRGVLISGTTPVFLQRLHHCPLPLGYCQLTFELLMLSRGQSLWSLVPSGSPAAGAR